jgi:5-methylcytosine-specific restriction protein A
VPCLERGITEEAKCVDHVIAHKGDQRLFWLESNWVACCVRCNSRKAASSEGGFGNEEL